MQLPRRTLLIAATAGLLLAGAGAVAAAAGLTVVGGPGALGAGTTGVASCQGAAFSATGVIDGDGALVEVDVGNVQAGCVGATLHVTVVDAAATPLTSGSAVVAATPSVVVPVTPLPEPQGPSATGIHLAVTGP